MKKMVDINAIENVAVGLEQSKALINTMHHNCISARQIGRIDGDMEVLFTILIDLNLSTQKLLNDIINTAYSAEG